MCRDNASLQLTAQDDPGAAHSFTCLVKQDHANKSYASCPGRKGEGAAAYPVVAAIIDGMTFQGIFCTIGADWIWILYEGLHMFKSDLRPMAKSYCGTYGSNIRQQTCS